MKRFATFDKFKMMNVYSLSSVKLMPLCCKRLLLTGCTLSAALCMYNDSMVVYCEAPGKKEMVKRNYQTEAALSEVLINVRNTLDQVHDGVIRIDSHDQRYNAIVHRDFIRIQIVSKSTNQMLEFVDCEYYWMTSDVSKADFCRVFANENKNNVLVELDDDDAFDMIYRSVIRISTDIPSGKCKITAYK